MGNFSPKLGAMARKDERLSIPSLGEYYSDLLLIDAAVNDRSEPTQAHSLLCSKLQEREDRIKQRVDYLAKKRGLTFDQMWNQILAGKFQKLSQVEFAELQAQQPEE